LVCIVASLTDIGSWTLRGIAALAGVSLIYFAIFLYEDEQGRLQNKLENFWINLSEAENSAAKTRSRLLRALQDPTSQVLERFVRRYSNILLPFLALLAVLFIFPWAMLLLGAAAFLTVVILAVAFSLHWLFWPSMSRSVYFLQTLGIERRRKMFFTLGVGLLVFAGLKIPDALKELAKYF
jgi:uncharacterized membrane protein